MLPAIFGALLCRALGLFLIVSAAVTVLRAFILGVTLADGQGTFEMLNPARSIHLLIGYHLADLIEMLGGVLILLCARPLGRLLARGLFTPNA